MSNIEIWTWILVALVAIGWFFYISSVFYKRLINKENIEKEEEMALMEGCIRIYINRMTLYLLILLSQSSPVLCIYDIWQTRSFHWYHAFLLVFSVISHLIVSDTSAVRIRK